MSLIDLKSSPAPLAPVSFEIAEPVRLTLESGIQVVLFENDRVPIISLRLAFQAGVIHDPPDTPGLTSAMASLLTEGTQNYTSLQLAEKTERLGASMSASASDDFTIVSASCLSLYTEEVVDLLAEVTLRPTFPEAELDLYRRNTIEHLRFQRSQPGFLAGEQAARLIFGDHPYSRSSPKPEDIEKLDRQALVDFHAMRFDPRNATLIVVGDVELDEIRERFDDAFAGWRANPAPPVEFSQPARRVARTITIVDRPGSAQSNIVITNLGVERTHPDFFPLLVMNQVLGAGASSRLFMNLREEKGYTYGAYTRLETKKLAGGFEATAEVRTTVTGESLKEFFYELDRIRDTPVGADELSDAKSFLTGVFPIRAETQEGLTNLIVSQTLYGLPADYLHTYRSNVDRVTSDDVQRVAREHIRPDEMAIVIVGDATDVIPQVSGYAEVLEVFDVEGKMQEVEKYSAAESNVAADVAGKWDLKIDFQGQSLPVSLILEQTDGKITGRLETMLGNGEISSGSVAGNKLTATATAEMQGRPMEFAITGKVDGEAMTGTISAPITPEPMTFSGSRK